jgi:glycerol-3-phosphate acyltransferase PlsY
MELLIKLILSYLLGSVSGSILMGKLKGVDIREMGSGNAGGTNAFRSMGAIFAVGVMFIDILKGFIAVNFIPSMNLGILAENIMDIELLYIICSIGVVLGHVYPVYYRFTGGKGAGTMIGVLAALFPFALVICLIFWFVIFVFTGYVGLSTIVASIILPISAAFYYEGGLGTPFGIFTIIISLFIIFTHRSNISRMIAGNENRFEKAMIFRKKSD